MDRQLFENTIRSDLEDKNSKDKLFPFLFLSAIVHLAIVIWLFVQPPGLPKPAPRPVKIIPSASMVFINPPPPPPPSSGLNRNTKKPVQSVEKIPEPILAPIEAPKEVKPEPPKEPKEAPTETASEETKGKPGGEPSGMPGGVPGGVPEGVPGGTGNDLSSQITISGPEGPVRPDGNIKPLKRKKFVIPIYPSHAQSARISGTVVIEAVIGKNGKIRSARAIRSIPALDRAAIDAIKKWEYEPPTTIDGRPVEVLLTVTVNFVLK